MVKNTTILPKKGSCHSSFPFLFASAMEKRGIRTGRGDLNREIEVTNQKLRQLKARISKLQNWFQRYLILKEEVKKAEKIRKSVYSILRQEQQPRRAQDMKR